MVQYGTLRALSELKKLSEMAAELEVLRKERQDLEVIFTVRTETIIVLASRTLTMYSDFQGARVHRRRLQTQEA